ncbi:hypothetical protein N9N67_05730 [Bacteriovoracaceae bacterium]|nr:hypothetical protein [Bacteriovoracaceae bacterium]
MEYNFEELLVVKENDGESTIFHFSGVINEEFLQQQIEIPISPNIVLDLDKVKLINSCGIREWIRFIQRMDQQEKIIYRQIPKVFINQMNIVKGFVTKNSLVESFYAPYFDEDNDLEMDKLIFTDQVVDSQAPVFMNEQGNELEFDAFESTYFKFLKEIGS